ncbi:MAG TPA: hydroxysqualene dehydroxylase HpnE [Caulobacteraceae bacterium]
MTERREPARAFVIGAGVAGLAAAVDLAGRGVRVELIEAATQAGGRCRSYVDPVLEMMIDNGNHLILSGNQATLRYLAAIGAQDRVTGPGACEFSFCDVRDDRRWTIRPNLGPLPWWVLDADRRVPGTRARDYLRLLALMGPQNDRRVEDAIPCAGPFWERLLAPLLLAALNTDPAGASAALAGAVIGETLARGGRAYRPRIAHAGLSAAFVDPAISYIEERGAVVRLGRRLRKLEFEQGCVRRLGFSDGETTVGAADAVILATPPWISQELVPDLTVPDRYGAIVNGHFAMAPPAGAPQMVGVIGGAAEWIFAFPDRLSVTVSGAEAIIDDDREVLARRLWRDVAKVHGLHGDLPACQIVKERRATFLATPEQNARRPAAETRWRNLFLAGDWTATGLPATIEGAIRSGQRAAALAQGSRH